MLGVCACRPVYVCVCTRVRLSLCGRCVCDAVGASSQAQQSREEPGGCGGGGGSGGLTPQEAGREGIVPYTLSRTSRGRHPGSFFSWGGI